MAEQRDASFWKTRFRLIQPNLRKIDLQNTDPEALAQEILDWGANAALINGGGIVAFYPTDNPYQPVNEFMQGDFLGDFLKAAHVRNLKVLVRMDVSKSFPHVLEEHPDWFRRTADGAVVKRWEMLTTCPTGPYWEEYNFKVVAELLRRYPVDGLFYNAYNYGQCFCARCKDLFRGATGHELPEKEDWSSPAWRAFVNYRYERFADYNRRLQAFVLEQTPGTVLTIDTHLTSDHPQRVRESGWNAAAFARSTGCITVEAFNTLTRSLPKWFYWAGEEVKLGSHLNNTMVILTYSEIFGSRRSGQPAAQVGYDLMQIAANGGAPSIAFSGTFAQDDRKSMPMIKQVLQFLAKHEAEYQAMELHTPVAVAYSQRTADFYGREEAESRWLPHYRGAYEALAESHIPFTVLHEEALLEQDLSRYTCIILPNIGSLSDQETAKLDTYVEAGGHLIATYETGLYDAEGLARREQALRSLGRTVTERRQLPGSYLWIHDKETLTGYPETDLMALDGEFLVTAPTAGAGAQFEDLTVIPSVKNNTPEFAYWESTGSEPGLIINTYGKGTAAYLPWCVDKFYHQYGVPEYRQLLATLVDRAAGPRLVQARAPGSVELIVAKRPGGGYLLHLLNATGLQSKPQTEIISLASIEVQIRGALSRARSLVTGQELPVLAGESSVSFTLPQLGLYDVIVVE